MKFYYLIIFHIFALINSQDATKKISDIYEKVQRFRRKKIKIPNIKDIYNDKYFYNKTDILRITVKNMNSFKNQIPYDYEYLDICSPENISHPKEGITELLTGRRMSYSNYFAFMNHNETCNLACVKNFTDEEIIKYEWLIDERYFTTYYLDKLPSGHLFYFKGRDKNSTFNKSRANYFSGIPVGKKRNKKYYVYNHFVFYIEINENDNKYQIVDFYISAHSVKQSNEYACIEYEGKNITFISEEELKKVYINHTYNISNNDNYTQDRIFNVLEDGTKRYYKDSEEQELVPGNIAFTYDVIFIKSNTTFSSRYDHYFYIGKRRYRWFGLITSNIIILILTCGIFIILTRTVNKDLDKYNASSVITDSMSIDEFGWKQISGDVFRPPRHLKTLSAFIGTGFEILCLLIVSLIMSIIGFKKPEIRLDLINNLFLCCILFAIISGFVSTFIYKNNGGRDWVFNCLVTAFLFPLIAIMVLGIIRILMSFEKSSAGFKISEMAILCLLWLFVSSPLVFVGSMINLMGRPIKYPCKINSLPTAIDKKPWYLHLKYITWFAGFIPFFTFFIEFVYLLKSLWMYQVYYIASFLSLSLIFAIIITSEISIIYVFINLCYGDHKWWWKSFFISASPALYVLIYSFLYFFYLGLTRLSAIIVYFLIMFLITIVVALVLGSCGTLLTFWFVYYIYSKIKID